jgi:CHAT domain-containing protein
MATSDHDSKPATTEELIRFLQTVPAGDDFHRDSTERMPGKDCPPAHLYMGVVLGTCDQAKGQELLDHAAVCNLCAQSLSASLRALDGNPSAEEANALKELSATQLLYQQELSRKLASTRARKRTILIMGAGTRRLWLSGAAAAVIALAAGGIFLWQRHAGAPDILLAKAYQESRTLELRIPQANFAALKPGAHTRGENSGNEPAALLEARAKLTRMLQASPQDVHSLELQARAEMLEEHYDAAIDILDRLTATGPVTAELLTDAATAYFQRGLVSGSELDRSTALDYLRRADELAPTDPVVLFNEAIVMQDRSQLMNAVEVWNRYSTVEHDAHWAAEGKRKLAELETILDRLKSHESRVMHMLSTPEAMDALASNPARLATWDEELSSVEFDKVLDLAFPEQSSSEQERIRGAPCAKNCMAARRLLYAIARSLQIQHHDDWVTDLLPADLETLSPDIQMKYAQAMRLLGNAMREDQTGLPETGSGLARQARDAFLAAGAADSVLRQASFTGELRAAAEEAFAVQRFGDFASCRAIMQKEQEKLGSVKWNDARKHYPWIAAFLETTGKICDDTPETRTAGHASEADALQLAMAAHYRLLTVRIRLHDSADAQLVNDQELATELIQGTLRDLLAADSPVIRVMNSHAALAYIEYPSARLHSAVLQYQEMIGWCAVLKDSRCEIYGRRNLAIAEIRLGAMRTAQAELQTARAVAKRTWPGQSNKADNTEISTQMAEALLERGDPKEAYRYLAVANPLRDSDTDAWVLSFYAGVAGQFELEQHHLQEAERVLEKEIHEREGKNPRPNDAVSAEEFAKQDHDLYGELAAAWLEDGRPVEDVLALWERFRLRSLGLPIHSCPGGQLNCERGELTAELHRMGHNLLTGEIVLMDRVLVYQADAQGIRWSTRRHARRDILDAAQTLERAVSSPATSQITAQLLGRHLADALLPDLPSEELSDATLYLEPDPQLSNLAWPVLPTEQGPLGLSYAMAELPSILARPSELHSKERADGFQVAASDARPLIIGASITDASEPPLPEAIEEARTVSSYLKAPTLLVGRQATIQAVTRRLPSASVLHFAGHAVPGKDGPRLLLAGNMSSQDPSASNPWIDGAFLESHPPRRCRLAVLSACGTGGHAAASVDPLQDLVETFYSLGVPQTVATRWQVDSEASVFFMKAFYASLLSGRSVAGALESARKLQFSNSTYNKPYYWGAYYVTGREQVRSRGELYGEVESEAHGK